MLCKVFNVPMNGPADVSEVKKLIDAGEFRAEDVVAFLGKTEGNGCVNDFTRGYATSAFQDLLLEKLDISKEDIAKKVAFVMSGGCEGVLSPHMTVFVREKKEAEQKGKRLAIGIAHTRDFLPEELGMMVQVKEVARGVKEAMKDAGIDDPEDVHFVQIKCPLLTSGRIEEAEGRGKKVITTDTYKSMGYSRGASALGVALALGEVEEASLSDELICKDYSVYSKVASTSAGVEMLKDEIIVMGNSTKSASEFVVAHSVMKDAIDAEAVREAMKNAGVSSAGDLPKIVNVFAKAEADPTGKVRGRRNTMLTDSDINHTRHARAVVNAVIASIIGDPMNYVSGGAEHQGPPGGGPVAVIARI